MIHDERILLGRLPGAVVLGLLLLDQTSCGWLWSEQYEWDPSRCAPGCSRCHNGACEIEGGDGKITVPGAGGGSGYGGGGGGGSGGAILLEAYEITGKGILAANGGGGSGRQLDGSSGQAGQCGQASTSFALGGVANRGSGGNGGSVQDAAKPGAQAENGGGGGGAAGRIRLFANAISTAQMTVSPAPSMSAGVPVW